MSLNEKRKLSMSIAEALDYFRVVPRIILVAYSYITYQSITWFMKLESPTTEQSALIVTILGVAGAIIGLYQKSGKTWTKDDFSD